MSKTAKTPAEKAAALASAAGRLGSYSAPARTTANSSLLAPAPASVIAGLLSTPVAPVAPEVRQVAATKTTTARPRTRRAKSVPAATAVVEALSAPDAVRKELADRDALLQYLHQNPRLLKLSFLVEHNLPIYVINNTRIGLMLTCDVKDKSGRVTPIVIENTDLPKELTQYVGGQLLLDSPFFNRLLVSESIKLVDPITAQAKLSTPAAQRKLRRMTQSRFSNNSTEILSPSFEIKPASIDVNVTPGAPVQSHVAGTVSDRLRALVVSYQEQGIAADELVDRVTDNARTFTRTDWSWLANAVPDHEEIQALCSQQLTIPSDPVA